jgi:hypothetical protein
LKKHLIIQYHSTLFQTNNATTSDLNRGGFGIPTKKSTKKPQPEKTNLKPSVNKKMGVDDFRMAINRGCIEVVKESVNNGIDI